MSRKPKIAATPMPSLEVARRCRSGDFRIYLSLYRRQLGLYALGHWIIGGPS